MDTLPVRLPRQCSGMETGANQCIHLLSGARRISRGPGAGRTTVESSAHDQRVTRPLSGGLHENRLNTSHSLAATLVARLHSSGSHIGA